MSGAGSILRETVIRATPRLLVISDESASAPHSPGKWSPKQIVGHLIDSASNNHQRFVRAQFMDTLVFVGYEQDRWVAVQQYQTTPWHTLVDFWQQYNLHLARVINAVPDDIRYREHLTHNLDQVAFSTVPQGSPATLDYFMRDYVTHLTHHLRDILTPPV